MAQPPLVDDGTRRHREAPRLKRSNIQRAESGLETLFAAMLTQPERATRCSVHECSIEEIMAAARLPEVAPVPEGLRDDEGETLSYAIAKACTGDAVLWMVSPKGTSKKYRCEFSRDSGWPTLAAAGFEPVRMVAVDDDWSALRFRRVEYIKTMARQPERAISRAGRRKAAGE